MDDQPKDSSANNDSPDSHPYDRLTPDCIISAVESQGYISDARILGLNSYENRVYQVGIEEKSPLIAKFYRPARWSNQQIQEEHDFTLELADLEIPVVPPLRNESSETLFKYNGFRFALYPRQGGHTPELDQMDNLVVLGRFLGRLHAAGSKRLFLHRPTVDIQSYGIDSVNFLSGSLENKNQIGEHLSLGNTNYLGSQHSESDDDDYGNDVDGDFNGNANGNLSDNIGNTMLDVDDDLEEDEDDIGNRFFESNSELDDSELSESELSDSELNGSEPNDSESYLKEDKQDADAEKLQTQFIPPELIDAYRSLSEDLLNRIQHRFAATPYETIRLHGDCHPSNILWREDRPHFVDFDDARNGPAIQDLWMLISGTRQNQSLQMKKILEGYSQFYDFNLAELGLIESLRTLRIMQYSAWLARRWNDPAFPHNFPWFNTTRYWADHILQLREQLAAMDEPPLDVK